MDNVEKVICCDRGNDALYAAYADLCKTLTPDLIIETGHAFFFEDEDAPCNKIWIYMESFE